MPGGEVGGGEAAGGGALSATGKMSISAGEEELHGCGQRQQRRRKQQREQQRKPPEPEQRAAPGGDNQGTWVTTSHPTRSSA